MLIEWFLFAVTFPLGSLTVRKVEGRLIVCRAGYGMSAERNSGRQRLRSMS
jgi:hypothetical protein